MASTSSDRLSRATIPRHYDLFIKTDLKQLTFDGLVSIRLSTCQLVDSSIVLHAHESLKIHKVLVSVHSDSSSSGLSLESPAEISRDHDLQQLNLRFVDNELEAKTVDAILISFSGELTDSMSGYYRNTYTKNGSEQYFAMTDFEPINARKAFPCFDEPSFKATFDIALLSRKDTVSISNNQARPAYASSQDLPQLEDFWIRKFDAESTPDSYTEWSITVYETTPKMSTYLVAYANGDFAYLESSFTSPLTNNIIPIRVYALHDQINQAEYTLNLTAKIVPIYEKMFGIPYTLGKLDTLIASDFESGAMENWGLITGRASSYLSDPARSSISAIKCTCSTQCHEIAHQWFGNIVTMEFWDGLWLNEAFADYMGSVIILEKLHPEWKVDSEFLADSYSSGAELDALRSCHPVEVYCQDSRLAEQNFDDISYCKGASILRQLANHIGIDTFVKGVSIYLHNNLYGNTKTNDLWKGISEASGFDVAEIMGSWVSKAGHPVVTVIEKENGILVKQNRFLITGDVDPKDDETIWYIPLEIKHLDEKGETVVNHEQILKNREMFITMPSYAMTSYKLNSNTNGFFRTNYSPERWSTVIQEACKPNSIFSLNDRIGLVQDISFLCRGGYITTSLALECIDKMTQETEYLVWRQISSLLSVIQQVFWEDEEIIEGVKNLTCKMFSPMADKITFDSKKHETPNERELRSLVLGATAKVGYEPVIVEIKRRFRPVIDNHDRSLIPSDLTDIIFLRSVQSGGAMEFEKMLEIYRNPVTSQDAYYCIAALANSLDDKLLEKLFSLILDGTFRDQDLWLVMLNAGKHERHRRKTWEFFKSNFEKFKEKFDDRTTMCELVECTADSLTTTQDLNDIESFYKVHSDPSFQQSLGKTLDSVKSNIAWIKRDTEDIRKWFKERV